MSDALKIDYDAMVMEIDDVMFIIKRLERRRQKITQRGRLTEAEDVELTEIYDRLDYWNECLSELLFEPEEVDADADFDDPK
jgi:hypothetical protein